MIDVKVKVKFICYVKDAQEEASEVIPIEDASYIKFIFLHVNNSGQNENSRKEFHWEHTL